MIATITCNPAIDITYSLSNFQLNQVNRVQAMDKSAGGKGLNVSRVLSQLGHDVICSGFLGGRNGEWIAKQLTQFRLMNCFVPIQEETRSCHAILSEGTYTEILEKGPIVTEHEEKEFLVRFDSLLEPVSFIILSGSLPSGVKPDFYSILIKKAKDRGKFCFVDTSAKTLVEVIKSKPYLIKPNKEELKELSGKNSLSDLVDYSRNICEEGTRYVLLSLGKEGALLISNSEVLRAYVPTIKEVNPVGSGDSMLAGFTHACQKGYTLIEALKWSCACGISNALSERTGCIDLSQVIDLTNKITVTHYKGI